MEGKYMPMIKTFSVFVSLSMLIIPNISMAIGESHDELEGLISTALNSDILFVFVSLVGIIYISIGTAKMFKEPVPTFGSLLIRIIIGITPMIFFTIFRGGYPELTEDHNVQNLSKEALFYLGLCVIPVGLIVFYYLYKFRMNRMYDDSLMDENALDLLVEQNRSGDDTSVPPLDLNELESGNNEDERAERIAATEDVSSDKDIKKSHRKVVLD